MARRDKYWIAHISRKLVSPTPVTHVSRDTPERNRSQNKAKHKDMTAQQTRLPRDVIEISGPDTRTFLQGLVSQDVGKVTPGHAAYGTLLTPQGKFLHDFLMADSGNGLILDTESGRGEELTGRLTRFKLRAKVEINTRPDLAVTAVFGDDVIAALGLAPDPGSCLRDSEQLVFVDPRTAELGVRILATPADTATFLNGQQIGESGAEDYDRLRIALAVPDGARDMEIEKSTLLESNIDLLNGIDWEKGCYMGQELTARTKYRGLVRRQLRAFRADGQPPEPGSAIHAGEKPVGDVRSVSGDYVLASVRTETDDDTRFTAENGTILLPVS